MPWVSLCPMGALTEGRGTVIGLEGGAALAVFLAGGQVHVLDNTCPHRGGDLGAGDILQGTVYCPLHAWPFQLSTGTSPTHPEAQVRIYPCRIREGMVEAELPT